MKAFAFHRVREQGVAAVELAILLPILIVVAFGITELGRSLYEYDTLAKSARAAARYLAVFKVDDTQVQTETKCVAVYGNPGCTGAKLLPGLATSMVQIQTAYSTTALKDIQTGSGAFDLLVVTIGTAQEPYRFVSMVPFVVPDIPFGPVSVAMPQSFY